MARQTTAQRPFGAFAPDRTLSALIAFARGRGTGWLSRRLAFLARKIGMGRIRRANRPVDTTVFGSVRMRLYPFHNVAEKRLLFTPQYFDPAERRLLAERLPKDAVFLDVGANVGGYALFVASVTGPDARVLAIEPQPSVHARLAFNIRANPDLPVEAVQAAIADREGEMTLHLSAGNEGEASLKAEVQREAGGRTVTVHALPMQVLMQRHRISHVDGMKIDVEGAEDMILVPFFRDADPALFPRVLVLENAQGRWQTDCVALAEANGYREVLRTRLNIVLERA
ncbi:FkbM family methyltransferase [Futiania mangrovi]|uniref:FkbM family methyltransferase n=1 Tax=Futiania mangrovi TaxID=2959716 RepID=A0A9J6PEE9_9PROT|nr:FkbM family methyltransferase [Futiania mangrovii]MCP1336782.1 FkbM family methyltransferase [Futiania mangrovii]